MIFILKADKKAFHRDKYLNVQLIRRVFHISCGRFDAALSADLYINFWYSFIYFAISVLYMKRLFVRMIRASGGKLFSFAGSPMKCLQTLCLAAVLSSHYLKSNKTRRPPRNNLWRPSYQKKWLQHLTRHSSLVYSTGNDLLSLEKYKKIRKISKKWQIVFHWICSFCGFIVQKHLRLKCVFDFKFSGASHK